MDTTTIILISLLIVVVMGFVFWYINNQAAILAEAEAEAEAAEAKAEAERLAAIAAALEAAADADADADADTAPSVSTHPLAGDKYIVVKGTDTDPIAGVIVPVNDATNTKKFEIVRTGARRAKMVITLEAVEGEADTYYLFAKTIERYMKYTSDGFNVTKKVKPTEAKYLKPYKIKFTSIGDEYAMSYMDKDDVQMFFGYDGTGAMTSVESVASILTTGLVALEDAGGVSSYILPGNFGGVETNFVEFEIADDDAGNPKTTIKGCLEALPDVDLGEEVDRDSLLAVAYKASENVTDEEGNPKMEDGNFVMTKPSCRVYPQSDTYSYDVSATGWVTTCVDETKNIEQGCLL
jgi:hypothetical protein